MRGKIRTNYAKRPDKATPFKRGLLIGVALGRGETVTQASIAAQFGISPGTAYDDIERIRDIMPEVVDPEQQA